MLREIIYVTKGKSHLQNRICARIHRDVLYLLARTEEGLSFQNEQLILISFFPNRPLLKQDTIELPIKNLAFFSNLN